MKKHAIIAALAFLMTGSANLTAESLYIAETGNVGVGTGVPSEKFHVLSKKTGYPVVFLAQASESPNALFRFETNDDPMEVPYVPQIDFNKIGNKFRLNMVDGDNWELQLEASGDLTIKGQLYTGSSRTYKENIVPADYGSVLTKLETLPIAEWTYIDDSNKARHIGPMAEDFAAIFKFGASKKQIAPSDMAGVALAAVKELSSRLNEKDAEISALRTELSAQKLVLDSRLQQLETMVKVLSSQKQQPSIRHSSLTY